MISEQPEYNNEEEAEVAQILALNQSAAAVDRVRMALAKQAEQVSLEECMDCGEEIPLERQQHVPGCQRCIFCQELWERKQAGY